MREEHITAVPRLQLFLVKIFLGRVHRAILRMIEYMETDKAKFKEIRDILNKVR